MAFFCQTFAGSQLSCENRLRLAGKSTTAALRGAAVVMFMRARLPPSSFGKIGAVAAFHRQDGLAKALPLRSWIGWRSAVQTTRARGWRSSALNGRARQSVSIQNGAGSNG
jgi:hypothetical protein